MGGGIVYGLTAALCWGVGDFFVRGSAREASPFVTLLAMQLVALVAFLAFGLPTGALSPAHKSPASVALTALISLAILVGGLLLYHAYAVGTLALMSPIVASFAAITALLAILSGERPTAPQISGIVLTLAGVILTSAVSTPPEEHAKALLNADRQPATGWRPAPGLFAALASTVIFGIAYWALRYVDGPLGGIPVVFISKVTELIALSLALAVWLLVRRRGWGSKSKPNRIGALMPATRFWVFLVPAALLDTAANVAYNVGLTHGLTAVVSVLSSLFSPVTVLLAWLFLRERLTRWQWTGVAAILAGVALVSV